MRPVLTTALTALLIANGSAASAAESASCARGLQSQDLVEAGNEALALANDFRTAFSAMKLDGSSSAASAVGATVMGSAMANEAGATISGLTHLVRLRDRVQDPIARGDVLSQLGIAMSESSRRMRRMSESYGKVARMAGAKDVQDLATGAMAYADGLALAWSCN